MKPSLLISACSILLMNFSALAAAEKPVVILDGAAQLYSGQIVAYSCSHIKEKNVVYMMETDDKSASHYNSGLVEDIDHDLNRVTFRRGSRSFLDRGSVLSFANCLQLTTIIDSLPQKGSITGITDHFVKGQKVKWLQNYLQLHNNVYISGSKELTGVITSFSAVPISAVGDDLRYPNLRKDLQWKTVTDDGKLVAVPQAMVIEFKANVRTVLNGVSQTHTVDLKDLKIIK